MITKKQVTRARQIGTMFSRHDLIYLIITLKKSGKTIQMIANICACSTDSVTKVWNDYQDGHIKSIPCPVCVECRCCQSRKEIYVST